MRLPFAATVLIATAALPALAQEVGRVGVDWTGNDIVIESFVDTEVGGVTCHLAYFERSLIHRLTEGNWFEDPSNSAIDCNRTGAIDISAISTSNSGADVFSESRSLILKSLRVKRIYDRSNHALVYLAHGREMTEGSAKMAVSVVPLDTAEAAGH